jgi:hypothetical protein
VFTAAGFRVYPCDIGGTKGLCNISVLACWFDGHNGFGVGVENFPKDLLSAATEGFTPPLELYCPAVVNVGGPDAVRKTPRGGIFPADDDENRPNDPCPRLFPHRLKFDLLSCELLG